MNDTTANRNQSTESIIKRIFKHENAILAIVLAGIVGTMVGATGGLTATTRNVQNVLLQSSVRGIAAVGQAFVILTAGIDLSVSGIATIATVLGAAMITQAPDLSILASPLAWVTVVPIMILVGAGVGAANGLSVSRIGLPPLIATLALWEITKGGAFQINAGQTIGDLPAGYIFLGGGFIAGIPVPIIIFIGVAATAYFVLNYTGFGRSVYAVGGNPVSAALSGINVRKILFSVYLISGVLAALAGIIFSSRIMAASLRTITGLELDTIAAVSIGGVSLAGGRGTIVGVILGVIIIGVINNGMSVLGAGPNVQGIVKGAIIFTAVAIDIWRQRQ